MSITNATNFRKNIYDHLENAIETNDIITVTTKSGNAVLINEAEYKSLIETAYLNSIPNVANTIMKGLQATNDEFVKVEWKNELSN